MDNRWNHHWNGTEGGWTIGGIITGMARREDGQ